MTDWTDPSNYDPDDPPPWERPKRTVNAKPIAGFMVLLALVFFGYVLFFANGDSESAGTSAATPRETPDRAAMGDAHDRLNAMLESGGPDTIASGDFGTVDEFYGSGIQARALLGLMEAKPDRRLYVVSFTHQGEQTIVAYLVDADELYRTHLRPGGRGTEELWRGWVVSRLRSAEQGGSLNDTPEGRVPGGFATF